MADAEFSRAVWRKSRRSNNGGNCVEVADLMPRIGVRDSKTPNAGHLSFTPETWAAFIADARDGHFDLP
ncbi:DUF397 domain-containing protein [Actinomadura syzygii]|uniref:DUF397 domain-containing protein n=1 Tax=Actinomadura syzygii TaxID=1427538 RepID=A0A5D0ULQ3_9ACTN|nr:DUF397 domain-containing protein [Actinomadura syzygii]TYC18837.1 DUF397 domain-containing protein [Actinomadura syzygii]